MYSDEAILRLIDSIYAAAGDPARWTEVLQRLALALGAAVGTMHHQDTSSMDSNFSSLWNLGPEAIVPYTAYYGARNPLFTARPWVIKTGAVNTAQMLCPDQILIESEYYRDYLRTLDLRECIAATLRNEGANSSNISIFRRTGGMPFGEEERKFLLTLVPHLQRAFQLHNRIQGLEQKGAAAADALEHLPVGLVMLSAEGKVLQVNETAAAVLAGQKGLRVTSRGLVAEIPSENQRLQRLIRGAITTGTGKGLDSGGAILIAPGGLKRSLQVLVVPLRTRAVQIGKDVPVAVIFISDPDREPVSEACIFAELFGLTPAEARLARILAAGDSLKDAAEQLAVAESTVKSQLKSIFAKTDTSRQSQLVRLVLLTLPHIRQSQVLD
jgi:DNA-binding CsgD family transcriptional regulator